MTVREIGLSEVQIGDVVRVWFDALPGRESDPVSEHRVYELTVTKKGGDGELYYAEGRGEFILARGATKIELLDRPDIQVGDRVRREPTVKGGVTIEFVVHEIAGGYLYPAHALGGFHHGWDSSRFTVVERAKR